MVIRNAAKAIILNQNKVLLNKNKNSIGDMCYGLSNGAIYYDLPGGGQNQYETIEEAVIRECIEESGYTVSIDRLAAIYEEISMNKEFREKYEQYAHKVHFIFICRLTDKPLQALAEKDLDMLHSEWVNIDDIKNISLFPSIIKANFETLIKTVSPLYLGSERI